MVLSVSRQFQQVPEGKLRWWTWRRRLSGAGCPPCCSCEGQSKPGWPPPPWTSESAPSFGPCKQSWALVHEETSVWWWRLYLLEKLEGLDGAPRVGEEQPQVVLGHVLPVTRLQSGFETGNGSPPPCGGAGEPKRSQAPGPGTYGMLDRCSVADGGKMFWKFLEPGFLKRCRGELA